jgi:CRISPR-associated protein Cas1
MMSDLMKKLLNTLYVTNPDCYLALEGEAIVIRKEEKVALRLPLHNLENIVCFNYTGASPALMGACADRSIGLSFLSQGGRFRARVTGRVQGNVLLRRTQYGVSENETQSIAIASSFIFGKIYNSRKVLERAIRDHALIVDTEALSSASQALKDMMQAVEGCTSVTDLMGFEGRAARTYFGVFNQLILQQREDFFFTKRSRRPPLDNLNSLLSFFYTVLTNEVASALETVGLDPYVGFLHQDRPGRPSLALDLVEELRPIFADRLVLSLINRKQIKGSGFTRKESGSILMDDETRKKVLTAWQERKKEKIRHPFLDEKIPFGLIPHVQALLLARYLRGDLDAYPPFFWS